MEINNYNDKDSINVCIAGLGLIGGSLAKALKARCPYINRIIAIDKNETHIEQALQDNIISEGYLFPGAFLMDCDVVFICTPVSAACAAINEICKYAKDGCLITDTASTKDTIMKFCNNLDLIKQKKICFIGGHPMAGTEKSGYNAGFASLFENAYYVICLPENVDKSKYVLLKQIINDIGAKPFEIDSAMHDVVASAVSHVPHVLAAALVHLAKKYDTGEGYIKALAAGGFKDMTRIASSNPDMWENICMENSSNIACMIDDLICLLESVKKDITTHSNCKVNDFFKTAKKYRDDSLIIP